MLNKSPSTNAMTSNSKAHLPQDGSRSRRALHVFGQVLGVLCLGVASSMLSACGGGGASSCSSQGNPVTGTENATTALATAIRAPLSGCTTIDYSVTLQAGSSAGIAALIDSGSTTLAVAGSGCSSCTSINPVYQPSGAAQNTCVSATSSYGDGSGWQGTVYNDTVAIGTMPVATVSLASISSQTQDFFSSTDCSFGTSGTNSSQGILGLAGSTIAISGTAGYLDVLNNSPSAFPNLFAVQMCMVGGNIWFGNYDPAYTAATPAYTPITQANSFFFVTLSDMLVGTSSVGVNGATFPNGVIVDTGTSIALMPQGTFNTLSADITSNATFAAQIGGSSFFTDGNCTQSTSMSQAQLDSSLPTLTLKLPSTAGGTISVVLPATRSYLDMHSVGGILYYCPGIAPDGGGSDPDIIGGAFLRSQIAIFDRNSNRIGFAAQNSLGSATGCTN